jgi:hypothetical protein
VNGIAISERLRINDSFICEIKLIKIRIPHEIAYKIQYPSGSNTQERMNAIVDAIFTLGSRV